MIFFLKHLPALNLYSKAAELIYKILALEMGLFYFIGMCSINIAFNSHLFRSHKQNSIQPPPTSLGPFFFSAVGQLLIRDLDLNGSNI